MIESVNYSLFPSGELMTFAIRTITALEDEKLKFPSVVPYLNNVSEKCEKFKYALERESKNPVTKQEAIKNEVCNDAFLAFRTYCEYAAFRRKEGWKEAANLLVSIIRKHGWSAQHMGYKAKSGILNNIVSEIRTKHPAQLTLINANELLNELEAAMDDFEATAIQFIEVAATSIEPTVMETRPELIVAQRTLLQFIGLQQIIAPSDDLTALINMLNELVVSSLSTLKASNTRAENNKKKEKGKTDTTVG
jgi:hypothetical protein